MSTIQLAANYFKGPVDIADKNFGLIKFLHRSTDGTIAAIFAIQA